MDAHELHERDHACLTHTPPGQSEHERIELVSRERLQRVAAAAGPDEAALVQPARGQPDADAVVHEDLQPRRTLVGKDVGVMRSRDAEDRKHLIDPPKRR